MSKMRYFISNKFPKITKRWRLSALQRPLTFDMDDLNIFMSPKIVIKLTSHNFSFYSLPPPPVRILSTPVLGQPFVALK